jgi:soluble lytic murein transglycosylase-like protein
VGAFLALAAAAVMFAAPRPLAEPPRRAPVPDPAAEAHADALRNVEETLAIRSPELPEPQRTRLADTLVSEAESAKLDPLFVLAVIEVESGWDVDARSNRGARGLMQLRPSTFRDLAEQGELASTDVTDPVANVQAGVRYLGKLHHAFRRSDTALMAYNAGPHRIHGYLHAEGKVPDRFKAYPKRVRREYHRLRRAAPVDKAVAVAR